MKTKFGDILIFSHKVQISVLQHVTGFVPSPHILHNMDLVGANLFLPELKILRYIQAGFGRISMTIKGSVKK